MTQQLLFYKVDDRFVGVKADIRQIVDVEISELMRPTLDTPHAVAGKRETSRAAARRVLSKTQKDRIAILKYVVRKGGATDKEMQQALKIEGDSQRPRRYKLVEDGLLAPTDEKRNNCTVWVATVRGEDEAKSLS